MMVMLMNRTPSNPFFKFLILCGGGFIASIGNGITSFGLSIYVFEQTGLVTSTTIIAMLAYLPALLLSPLAGILADRYDRRLLMILGEGLSALGLVYILFCMFSGEAQLWQIGVGVTIRSFFSSLIDPAFKATITDLLNEEEYSKASGFVQMSDSAKFLISPILAGYLLVASDIKMLIIIDICTILLTVITIFMVRKGLVSKVYEAKESVIRDFKTGWIALTNKRGVFILTIMGACVSFFLTFIQSLSTPMSLAFAYSQTIGAATSIYASGMLASSVLLGFVPIKKGFLRIQSYALFFAGLFMVGFGLRENIIMLCIFGFLFFTMIPFANMSIDYLIRTNVDNDVQGRVWGLISVIFQLGYVVANAVAGPLADYVFVPLLAEGGALTNSVGKVIGVGSGRGIGLLIIVAGILLAFTAIILYRIKFVRELENRG